MNKTVQLFQDLFGAIRLYSNFWVYWAERLGLFSKMTIMLRLRNGARCMIGAGTTDNRVMNEVWHRGIYDRLFSYLQSDSTVVDIGASIGAFAVKVARLVPHGKVLACEPIPRNMELLKQNIAANHLENVVIPLEYALGSETGTMDLFTHEGDAGGASRYSHQDKERTKLLRVNALTLQALFQKYAIKRCDFLKMDCEGAEEEIILTAPPELFARIHSMTIEWHEELSNHDLPAFLDFLKNRGYAVEFEETTSTIYAKR